MKFHERNMLSRILREWADYAAEEKMATWNKERQAKQHNIRRVILNTPHLRPVHTSDFSSHLSADTATGINERHGKLHSVACHRNWNWFSF